MYRLFVEVVVEIHLLNNFIMLTAFVPRFMM